MRVYEREIDLEDDEGTPYDRAYVHAEPQPDGTWQGLIQFVSVDGENAVQTHRETSQSTADAVAYWASGLELSYYKGALARAFRRKIDRSTSLQVTLRLITDDPELPFQLMATRTLTPGTRRYIHNAGVIRYQGPAAEPIGDEPGVYEFNAQLSSDAAAAIMADQLWRQLRNTGATLEIDGLKVPVQSAAIKSALASALYSVR